jgi:hypothetical protein
MSAIGQNGPLIGQIADILTRLRATLAPWFPPPAQSPVLQSVLTGQADQFNFIYQTLQFAANQTRIATATGGWLDLIAWDFFGARFIRRLGEVDSSFQVRIVKEILRPRQTRAAIAQMVTDLVGTAPIIYEPWNAGDNGGYGIATALGYGLDGSYGSLLFPNQVFVACLLPPGNGIPLIAGYGDPQNGYGACGGLGEYSDNSKSQGVISLAEIYARISQVIAAGTIAWVDIVAIFPGRPSGPGMYPPWRKGGFDNPSNDVIMAAWIPPPPPPWFGNLEELQARLLAPVIENVPVNNPPFGGFAHRASALAGILAAWIPPDPWFVNGDQPYDSRTLPPQVVQIVPNPAPDLAAGQLPTNIELVVDSWRPGDPLPFEHQQLPTRGASWIISIPTGLGPSQESNYGVVISSTIVAAWTPADPVSFEGGMQPAAPLCASPSLIAVPVNPPPFTADTIKTQIAIVGTWTPPDPIPLYWQPYAPKVLAPQLLNNPPSQPPLLGEQGAIAQQIASQTAQTPDPLPTLWPPQSI